MAGIFWNLPVGRKWGLLGVWRKPPLKSRKKWSWVILPLWPWAASAPGCVRACACARKGEETAVAAPDFGAVRKSGC